MLSNLATDRQQLRLLIQQWNENRYDLFNLSTPDENDEFHGVIRFYYQEPGEKISTKCVRVSSTATTQIVLEALVEKFRPDLIPPGAYVHDFAIYEVHESGEEQRLELGEFPLICQLKWHKDDREGRFLFKLNESSIARTNSVCGSSINTSQIDIRGSKKDSKRFNKQEKKELRKKYKKQEEELRRQQEEEKARRLYDEVPPTTFARTISNPEAVMKKRREQRFENKLKSMDHGGSMKVYGGELNSSRPYVTLLVSATDRAYKVVRETLDKYGLENASPDDYVLVEITLPAKSVTRSLTDLRSLSSESRERYLADDDRPILSFLDADGVDVIFAIRKRPQSETVFTTAGGASASASVRHSTFIPSYLTHPSETASLSSIGTTGTGSVYQQILGDMACEPALIPLDAYDRDVPEQAFSLRQGVTEIGCDPTVLSGYALVLPGDPGVQPKHAAVSFQNGVVAVTPLMGTLEVNGVRAATTQLLRDGFVIRFGGGPAFRYQSNQAKNIPNYACPTRLPSSFELYQPMVQTQNLSYMPPATSYPQQPVSTQFSTFPEPEYRNIPAVIELYDQASEDEFIHYVISEGTPEQYPCRLTPAFLFYMVCRYRLNKQLYRPGLPLDERQKQIQLFCEKISERIFHTAHMNASNKEVLALWLSNVAEFLHAVQSDRELSVMAGPVIMTRLQNAVENIYELLVESARASLQEWMPALLNQGIDDRRATQDVIKEMDDLVRILRKARLNAALTIQLFSRLFYFINTYAFNWLVRPNPGGTSTITRAFGLRLRERLHFICRWAEQQGLELAAECHIDRIQQAVNLLTTPKTIDQIASLGATCYKLNSVQARFLLENFVSEMGEARPTRELVEHIVALAQQHADVMAVQDGQRVQLEESPLLNLPFVFPSDGFAIELFHGISPDMSDLIASLQAKGICRLLPQTGSTGSWTVHMHGPPGYGGGGFSAINNNVNNTSSLTAGNTNFTPSQTSTLRASLPSDMIVVRLFRSPGEGIGLSIVAAQSSGEQKCGIYVKKVFDGSAAAKDGRIHKGDLLLSVNGHSLVGITQEDAAQRITTAGQEVTFEVAKRVAYYNGIIDSLDDPTSAQLQQQQQGPPQHLPRQPYQLPSAFPATPPVQATYFDPQPELYRHTRSASSSELFAGQADNVSLGSTTQPGNGRLPSHYKPSSRPAVLQPARPNPSPGLVRRVGGAVGVSPTPLYAPMPQQQRRSASTVPFQQKVTQPQREQWLENYSNLPHIENNNVVVPSKNQNLRPTGLQAVSSNGSSPLPAPPGQGHAGHTGGYIINGSYVPPPTSIQTRPDGAEVRAKSGRLSAPIFDHPSRNNFVEEKTSQVTRPLTTEQLDMELEAIESKGDQMTERDIARYHELLGHIGQLSHSRSTTTDFPVASNGKHHGLPARLIQSSTNGVVTDTSDTTLPEPHRLHKPNYTLPFMSEMASKLESKKAKSQEPSGFHPTSRVMVNNTTTTAQVERDIDDVTRQFRRIEATPHEPLLQSTSSSQATTTASPSPSSSTPSKTVLRDGNSPPEDKSRKRVQFAEMNIQASSSSGNNYHNSVENGYADESRQAEPEFEPRVQIVGKHEVYNDPRQRRLNEIQEKKAIKPLVDGERLAFRDKMRMFASQLGESTPPRDRQKVSSAQREIEQTLETS